MRFAVNFEMEEDCIPITTTTATPKLEQKNKKLRNFFEYRHLNVRGCVIHIQRTATKRKITATMLLNFKLHKIASAFTASFRKNKRLERGKNPK